MFLQGSLQAMFDALYETGTIAQMLKMDWKSIQAGREASPQIYNSILRQVSQTPAEGLLPLFKQMPKEYLYAVALEVANEYADFTDRKDLH